MGFLSEIVSEVKRDLDRHPLDGSALMSRIALMPPTKDLSSALAQGDPAAGRPAIIAEFKRASPSAGEIADADPSERARVYGSAGASAMSVLTEPHHFSGSMADLRAAHLACELPILRKDFLVRPEQLMEARAAGADAALLIASSLSASELAAMVAAASDIGLAALVETHSDDDLEKALAAGATIVGVNSRDLETLEMDEDRALAQLSRIPSDRIAVFESGIRTRDQVKRAAAAGARAVLVGGSLMRAPDPAAKLRELLGEEPQ